MLTVPERKWQAALQRSLVARYLVDPTERLRVQQFTRQSKGIEKLQLTTFSIVRKSLRRT
jgi:hypothetical protein